jgi:hypothetical protein
MPTLLLLSLLIIRYTQIIKKKKERKEKIYFMVISVLRETQSKNQTKNAYQNWVASKKRGILLNILLTVFQLTVFQNLNILNRDVK